MQYFNGNSYTISNHDSSISLTHNNTLCNVHTCDKVPFILSTCRSVAETIAASNVNFISSLVHMHKSYHIVTIGMPSLKSVKHCNNKFSTHLFKFHNYL